MKKSTISKTGHLIDPYCDCNGDFVEDNNLIYNCTLNQTEIMTNKNKFYILQLIENGNDVVLYTRWGRIGDVGSKKSRSLTRKKGISEFKKIFCQKTGNRWGAVFNSCPGKYFMAKIETAKVDSVQSEVHIDYLEIFVPELLQLLQLISNKTFMKNNLAQLEIDSEKMPIGKISQEQIDDAYLILDEINKNLENPHYNFINSSSRFYTLIPYVCGRRKPPIINDTDTVGKFVQLLDSLSQMAYGAITVTKSNLDFSSIYDDLNTELYLLPNDYPMYSTLAEYIKKSKAPTHNFNYEIVNIFEMERKGERETYLEYSKNISNKTLLFHGTGVCNTMSIMKNGLIVDPSKLGINVSITGKMFGMGLYFANSCSKSIQYCNYNNSDGYAILFIAEVALGNCLQKYNSDSGLNAVTLPKNYNSTWGIGSSTIIETVQIDGVQIPSGKLTKKMDSKCNLLYDEFIVYDERQVNIKYLALLKVF